MRLSYPLPILALVLASLVAQAQSIPELHGPGRTPPLASQIVTTEGIVTLVLEDRFWIQSPGVVSRGGLLIITENKPAVRRGDRIAARGTLEHFVPENRRSDLGVTRLVGAHIEVISSDHPLPEPITIGADGLTIPTRLAPASFGTDLQPDQSAIDFWTALTGMRVALPVSRVVGPTSRFLETWVIASDEHRNLGSYGTVAARPGDFNAERILIQSNPLLLPVFPDPARVGDLLAPLTGVVDYRFGNFRIIAEHAVRRIPHAPAAVSNTLVGDDNHLLIASYNVENLNPWVEDFGRVRSARDVDDAIGSGRMAEIARHIALLMNAPDIIGLQEIQDGDGAEDSALVSADRTLNALTNSIVEAGGPRYRWIDLPPEANSDGGQPGGNIRNVFLYNPARVGLIADSAQRLDGPAFINSRKSLIAEFTFNGRTVVVINNHFASKGGSDPLFGSRQPPLEGDADQRMAQAEAVMDFAATLRTEKREHLVVLGDLNDHWFSSPLSVLTGDSALPLINLIENQPTNERFTYVFQGNAQAIDHILVSEALGEVSQLGLLPINSLDPRQAADHDPLVVRLFLPSVPR